MKPKNFSCFICNALFPENELKSGPKNVSMEFLVSIIKKRGTYVKASNEKDEDASDFTVTCTQCEEGTPATRWCMICEDAEMCEECYKSHCRLKVYKSHKTLKLEELIQSPSCILNCRPLCKSHRAHPLEFYCKVCHMFMCQHCMKLDSCKCQAAGYKPKHDLETIDDVYEAKIQKIKEANSNLQAAQQRVVKKLQCIENTSQELNRVISEEAAWVKEKFQEIRKLVDQHEKELLRNFETIQSTGENVLRKQSTDLSQHKEQLTRYRQFTSGMLLPFRFQEVFMYSDWIPKYLEDPGDELAYRTEDMVISRGSIDLDDLTHKLLSLHQIFHHPHFPHCSVELLSKTLALVKVKIMVKDKYGLPVPDQMSHLDIQSEKSKSFFTELNWELEGSGVYVLSYCPLVKELHSLSITWNGAVLGGIDMVHDFIELTSKSSFCWYNKRPLVKPLFLASSTSGSQIVISDPGDHRLVVTQGSLHYRHVITNYNYPDFYPAGVAVGLDDCCLFVANSVQNCIYRYDKLYYGTYRNHSASTFGETGIKDGQFQCP